jgi:hypothetical protein
MKYIYVQTGKRSFIVCRQNLGGKLYYTRVCTTTTEWAAKVIVKSLTNTDPKELDAYGD